MHYYIITGASRGLGEAIAKKLLGKNSHVYCLSRTINNNLISLSKENNFNLTYVPCDLSLPINSNHKLQGILDEIPPLSIQSITLINNAATIEPIRHIDNCSLQEITDTFNVNLLTPVTFTSTFIRKFKDLPAKKKVINISSTGSKKSYDGLSCYISSKAGLSQFTKVVAEEQKDQPYPVETMLVEPGSMDTEMQKKISSTPEKHCSWVERFREIRKRGLLGSVETTAEHVFRLVSGKLTTAGNGKISGFLMTTVISLPECYLVDSPILALL